MSGLGGVFLAAIVAGSANASETLSGTFDAIAKALSAAQSELTQQAPEGDFFVGPAGTPCAKTVDLMARRLALDFHELAIGIGWTSTINGSIAGVTQLFASKIGTWTLIFTVADGVTCITMSGEGWDRINVELPDTTRRMMSLHTCFSYKEDWSDRGLGPVTIREC